MNLVRARAAVAERNVDSALSQGVNVLGCAGVMWRERNHADQIARKQPASA